MKYYIPIGTIRLNPLAPFTQLYCLPILPSPYKSSTNKYCIKNTNNSEIEFDPILIMKNSLENPFTLVKPQVTNYKPELGLYKVNQDGKLKSAKEPMFTFFKNINMEQEIGINYPVYPICTHSIYSVSEISLFAKLEGQIVKFYSNIEPINLNEFFESNTQDLRKSKKANFAFTTNQPEYIEIIMLLLKETNILDASTHYLFKELTMRLQLTCRYNPDCAKFNGVIMPKILRILQKETKFENLVVNPREHSKYFLDIHEDEV